MRATNQLKQGKSSINVTKTAVPRLL